MTGRGAPPVPRRSLEDDLGVPSFLGPDVPGDGTVVVQGPGGSGKTLLLASLARGCREAGIPVVDLAAAPSPADVTGDLAVLVDDAHRLSAAEAARAGELAALPGVRVLLAHRPWPRPAALLELLDRLRGAGAPAHAVTLGHAGPRAVNRWAADQLGSAATPALVDFVVRQTGGLPALVQPLLRSFARSRSGAVRSLHTPEPAVRLEVPPEVVDRISGGLAALGDDARRVLHAVAAGAPLDAELLAEALGGSMREASDQLAGLRAGGFLLPSGELIPLVRARVLAEEPPEGTRSLRRRFLGLLVERGDRPVDLARALVADGVRDPRAGRVLEEQAATVLSGEPALAGELLDLASSAGLPPASLAARRAEAAALAGDAELALQHADGALHDLGTPGRALAAAVAASTLAQRGFPGESIELYRAGGPEHAGSLALALIAAGDRAAASAVLATAERTQGGLPTLRPGAVALAAQGVLASLESGSCDVVVTGALSTLARSTTLLEPVGRTALMPDTPAALSALVALHAGEFAMAESVLNRALTTEVGGPAARPRHLLLLGWTAMLRGRLTAARAHVAEARIAAEHGFEPRDELCVCALDLGIARRSSDPAVMDPHMRLLIRRRSL
jgi:hypothetical protein